MVRATGYLVVKTRSCPREKRENRKVTPKVTRRVTVRAALRDTLWVTLKVTLNTTAEITLNKVLFWSVRRDTSSSKPEVVNEKKGRTEKLPSKLLEELP